MIADLATCAGIVVAFDALLCAAIWLTDRRRPKAKVYNLAAERSVRRNQPVFRCSGGHSAGWQGDGPEAA